MKHLFEYDYEREITSGDMSNNNRDGRRYGCGIGSCGGTCVNACEGTSWCFWAAGR